VTVEEFLKRDIRLPSPPAIAVRIIDVVKHDDFSFNQLASIIQSDPALSGRILRVANSSLYAIPRRVSTIEMAVALLGANTLKNIALSFTLPQVFQGCRAERFDFDHLWRRSLTAAVAAQLLSQNTGFNSDETFITSLLQDIGVATMFAMAPDDYSAVLDEKAASGLPVSEVERHLFGFDHQEVGAHLLKMWGLSDRVYVPIRHHHEPDSAPAPLKPLCNLLLASDRLSAVYHGSSSVKNVLNVKELLSSLFGLNEEQAVGLIDKVAENSIDLMSQFNLDPGQLKPFTQILQEANEELSRLGLSYEMVVMELRENKRKAERLAAELKAANEKLREVAFKDALTGLYNYRYLQESLVQEIGRANRYHHPLGLILVDLDQFKVVNDRYGHRVADDCLKLISARIAQTSRASDIVARYGGDEIAIALPETNLETTAAKAEVCRAAIESMEIQAGSATIRVTISVGVAVYDPNNPVSKDKLLESADQALYHSKHEGRNRVTVWEPVEVIR
jgi:diguanylate cyclase (GGDEF)-like protein